ncbi:AAA family ATPase [uncultured Ruegeria sp.]|uniref:AAA family ATPase n=1 Tax=uncultured Ruegeria sp. TaxID=259304 RepID=UPI00262CAE92|nr:AAA family ATPase [uncultured Ruegeria sp.]
MAVYYFNVSILSRGSGNGAIAAAAYRHGIKVKDITTGRTFDYGGKDEVAHTWIAVPEDAPDWAKQRYLTFLGDSPEARAEVAKVSTKLWEDLTLIEVYSKHSRRDRARLSRSVTFALPLELSFEEKVKLGREFVQRSFAERGMIADCTFHDLEDNPHIHVMASMRDLGPDAWGKKNMAWDHKSLLRSWRMEWANAANIALERAGLHQRIDHRTLEEQGIELKPDSYNPHVAEHAEQSGDLAREKDRITQVRRDNAAYLRANPEHVLTVVSAKATIFSEQDIENEFKRRLDDAGQDEVRSLVNTAMASRELVELDCTIEDRKGEEWPGLTTRARAYRERNLVLDAKVLARQSLDVDGSDRLDLLSEGLRETQRNAALEMVSPDRLSLVTGYGGVGKTYTIGEAAKVWKARGYEVLGGAISGKATQELSTIPEMEIASLAAWESRWARGALPVQGKFVFFLDEIGMVGGDTLVRVLKRVSDMGGKLIVSGDGEQLQPVMDSSIVDALLEVKDPVLMDQIVRQKNEDDLKASWHLAQGGKHIDQALDYYDGAGHIHFLENNEEAFAKLVQGYFDAPVSHSNERIAGAVSNRDVWALQDLLRAEAINRGVLGEREQDLGEIIRIDHRGLHDVRLKLPLLVREGERLIFITSHRELGIPKSSMGTVVAMPYKALDILLDGADTPVRVHLEAFNRFDYAYAATIHKMQGMSKERVHILAHPRMNRYLGNVAMTRHEEGVDLYVSEARIETLQDLKDLFGTKSHLWIDGSEEPDEIRRAGTGLVESGLAKDRLDLIPVSETVQKLVRERFIGDPHLSGIASRVGGLLSAEFVEGDPILEEDPQGYAQDPWRVIDEMMERQAVFRATDVADVLSRITKDPETFLRLFKQAMEHPDLVILDEGGRNGEGRIYSTRTQVAQEMNVLDRGVRLSLLEHLPSAGTARSKAFGQSLHGIGQEALLSAEIQSSGLTREQEAAFRSAIDQPGLSLVSGPSGSGKTRVAGALARAYRAAGVKEVNAIAPTSAGVDRLRRAGESGAMSIRQFEERVADGRIALMPRSVIVLDDAGLVGAETADRLIGLAETHGSKIVALRDTHQFAALEASPVFRMLEDRVGGHRLGDSLRQVDPVRKQLLEAFRQAPTGVPGDPQGEGPAERGLSGLMTEGVFQAGETRVLALDRIAKDYVRDAVSSKLVVAQARADVNELNRLIRENMDARYPERAVKASPFGNSRELAEAPIGSIAALRPGDRILLAGGYFGANLPAGSEGEVLRHDDNGVALLMAAPDGTERHLTFSVEDRDFRYRFGFASTVHGADGRSHGSLHVLATPGMTRHVLDAAMSLHQTALNVVLPVPEDNLGWAVRAIQRKDGTGRGALDYGFDVSLAAREALRGQAVELREDAIVEGAERLALWMGPETVRTETGVPETSTPDMIGPTDVPPARALPHGIGGEVMAELIGGQILETGTAPTNATRSALTDMVRHVAGEDDWQSLRRRLPPGIEARADQLALDRAGSGSDGRSLPAALALARGAVAAEALGEDALAERFQRGIDLYGARAEEARRGPGIEGLEPRLVDDLPDPWSQAPAPVLESPASAEIRAANAAFLRAHPEHMLSLVAAERAIFTEEELVRSARSYLEAGRGEARDLAELVLDMPEVVQIAQAGPGGQAQYSTGARSAVEMDLISRGVAMATDRFDVDEQAHLDLLSSSLTKGQRPGALAMLDAKRLTLVTGDPGAGKSYVIGEAAKVWQARGYEVIGGASSGPMTQQLTTDVKHLDVATLAAWESRWERGWRPASGRFVFFMDEAGMVGGDTWARVQKRIDALGGKLVAVGGPGQLQPTSESSAQLVLMDQEQIGFTAMYEVIRQENHLERHASKQLEEGGSEAISALRFYHDKGDIRFTEDVSGAIAQIAQRYFERGAPGKRIALAYTNRDVWALNAALRSEAGQRGELQGPERDCGEIVRILRDGERERKIHLSLKLRTGDRIMFTASHRGLRIPKSSFGTVQAIRAQQVDILIDKHTRPVTVDLKEFSSFDYGYATTVHKSQGMSKDYVYGLGHGYMNRHVLTVMATRHHQAFELYAPKDRLEDMAALEAAMLRSAYLRLDDPDADPTSPALSPRRSSPGLATPGVVEPRADLLPEDTPAPVVAFEADAHLSGVANRISGLLKAEFTQGQELVGEDPWGYMSSPAKVVDDLLKQQSNLRAADVAGALTRVTQHPATFLRLFREAMQHPDLIIMSDEEIGGEGRIYSTKSQVAFEAGVVDQGLRLGLSTHLPARDVKAPRPDGALLDQLGRRHGLDEQQSKALRDVANGSRLSLVRGGSGSGKTRLASMLATGYREAGSDHVYTLAPTGAGLGALREAGERRVFSARHFTELASAGSEGADPLLSLTAGSMIVLDDAGQLDADIGKRLFDLVEKSGAQLVMLADPEQPGPFGAGPVWQMLEARMGSIALGESHRQSDPGLAKALLDLAAPEQGERAAQGLKALEAAGVFQAGGTSRATIETLARDYVADGSETKIALAWSGAEVEKLNTAIRAGLDEIMPERAAFKDTAQQTGSVAALQVGDRIALTEYYDAAALGPGSIGDVVARDAESVRIRLRRPGGAEKEVVFKGEDEAFRYRFAFASTVHGARCLDHGSVHLLVNPAMSREVLNTGMALHKDQLNVVVPASEDRHISVVRKILQTDGRARGALDYGFDPALAMRQAARGETLRLQGSDGLPAGIGAEAIGEVTVGAIRETGTAPAPGVRYRLDSFVRQSIRLQGKSMLQRRGTKDLVARAERLALATAGPGRDGKVMPAALVLARGAELAETRGEADLATHFRRGLDLYAEQAHIARAGPGIETLEAQVVEQIPNAPEAPAQTRTLPPYARRGGSPIRLPSPRRLSNLIPNSEAAAARAVLKAFVPYRSRGPGFVESFLKAYKENSLRMTVDDRATLTRSADGTLVIDTGQPLIEEPAPVREIPQSTAPARPAPPRLGHLARSLASAVTQHIDGKNPVHQRANLRGDLRRLLADGARFAPDDPGKVEAAAHEIARRRHINAVKLDVIDMVLKESGSGEKRDDYHTVKAVHRGKNPFDFLNSKNAARYDKVLQASLQDMVPSDYEATNTDRAIARATAFLPKDLPENTRDLAKAVVRATVIEPLPDPEVLRKDRLSVLEELSSGAEPPENRRNALAEKLYKVFTIREIDQLVKPNTRPPRGIDVAQQGLSGFKGALRLLFQQDKINAAPWGDHQDAIKRDMFRVPGRGRGFE